MGKALIGNFMGPQGPEGPAGPQGPRGPKGDPGTNNASDVIMADRTTLEAKIDKTYVLDRINPITSGSLNDYITPGIYNVRNSDIAKNITDQPDGYNKSGFKLIVEYIGFQNMILQTIIYQGSLLHTYNRLMDKGTWYPWYGGPSNQWDAIGQLTNLQTTEKGSLVGAINELNSDLSKKLSCDIRSEVLTCQAGTLRSYTFPDLPTHRMSFPVLGNATGSIAGCVASRNPNVTGGVYVYSPISQDVQVFLILLI